MLEIKKIADDLYVATASPPEINVTWVTPEPLSARRLLRELIDIRGGHSSDIGSALYAQDPKWLEKANGPYE